VKITNDGSIQLLIRYNLEGDVSRISNLDKASATLDPGQSDDVKFTAFGQNASAYTGSFSITGTIEDRIPINITISALDTIPVEALTIDIEPITEQAVIGDIFQIQDWLKQSFVDKKYNVTVHSSIDKIDDEATFTFDKSFFTETDIVELDATESVIKEFDMPDFIRPGNYVITVNAEYLGISSSSSRRFRVVEPFWDHVILGILPVRWVVFLSFFVVVGLGGYLYYLKRKAARKDMLSKSTTTLCRNRGQGQHILA